MSIDQRFGDDILLEQVEREEDILLQASDATDSKASQIFSAAALIATQPAILFALSNTPFWVLAIQTTVLFPLVWALVCAHDALALREYTTSDISDKWRDGVVEKCVNETDARNRLTWSLLSAARGRVETTIRQNICKQRDLAQARGALTASIVINCVTILAVILVRLKAF